MNDNAYGEEGSLLVLRVANTTGAAITLRYILMAIPMGESGEQVALPPDSRVMMQGPTSIANNTVDQQLLDGLRYERAPVDSLLDVLMTASATGMTRQVFVNMDRIAPPSAVSLNNRIPQDPLDTTVGGIEAPKDELLQLSVSNSSGGALNVFWKIKLTELYRS
jgi:hypothetical protein